MTIHIQEVNLHSVVSLIQPLIQGVPRPAKTVSFETTKTIFYIPGICLDLKAKYYNINIDLLMLCKLNQMIIYSIFLNGPIHIFTSHLFVKISSDCN